MMWQEGEKRNSYILLIILIVLAMVTASLIFICILRLNSISNMKAVNFTELNELANECYTNTANSDGFLRYRTSKYDNRLNDSIEILYDKESNIELVSLVTYTDTKSPNFDVMTDDALKLFNIKLDTSQYNNLLSQFDVGEFDIKTITINKDKYLIEYGVVKVMFNMNTSDAHNELWLSVKMKG